MKSKAVLKGLLAALILLLLYFTIVTLVSGWDFSKAQFFKFWYFIITLSIGFGVQVGLYTYLKSAIYKNTSPNVLAVSGTISTSAMISCCAHYLVNLLPVLGAVGVITIITQYQLQLFWVGLAFNFAGILYMTEKVIKFSKSKRYEV